MNNDEKRRYDTGVRIRQFGAENAADFPAGSVGATEFSVMVARRILEGLVQNKYPGRLAAWTSASHIEKAPQRTPPRKP